MPLYTAIGQEGTISTGTKEKLAEEIARRTWSVSRAIIEPNYLISTARYSVMEGFFREKACFITWTMTSPSRLSM
jgi:hypothetical protein